VSKLSFGAPLYLYVDCARPELGMTELLGVDDGLAALHGGDIGRYRFAFGGAERDAWGRALFALTSAKFHPRLDKTEAARSALRGLASAAGALVTIRGSAERGASSGRTG
jgi:hypothetical protein